MPFGSHAMSQGMLRPLAIAATVSLGAEGGGGGGGAGAHAATVTAARLLGAPLVVVFTKSGFSARIVSSQRPDVPILAITDVPRTWHQLALVWGVIPALVPHSDTYDEMFAHARREVLARVCAALGVSAYEVVQMEALLRMQQAARRPEARSTVDRVAEAYEVLGVARSASDAEVTKSYRRLMNQNHPDKLVAKGLPESMMKVAAEKTRQIRAAYELLREARGMK